MSQSYTDMKKHTDVSDSFWSFGKEQDFKPHIRHVEPVLTECDLDWKSHLRWIPEPRYSDAPFPHIKDIKFPDERKLMRSFPQANMMSESEWSFYPNFGQPKTYHTGKKCYMDGINHTRSMRCISENSLESSMGRKKQDKCSIPLTKVRPFLVPEYSPDFHKYESTLRRTTFGPPYAEKHKSRLREEDILEVQSLSSWRPAPDIYDRTVLQDTSFVRC
ncbi:spermatogenesis-associated serine-rich protein 1 isoform X2 [Rhinichthys klamathensis goyatoka]|uniref:spermatogenesis-associated serine-rich protein 1 isoform X2 n=1 Tax=Rhinichthys klamathensis goyatoka TaxID=3034132 RepID=UPI0024B48875|nr:spermatogenesis-associated serine-rich protein 1 isoform X2 [Rhinichthys klamathensis goyatoka]